MSHQVTTPTSFKTSSNAIRLNCDYIKTIPGMLTLNELILGAITVGCVAPTSAFGSGDLFCLLMATAFMICTFCLLLSYVITWRNSRLVSETIFEFIYYVLATIFLFASLISLSTVGYHHKGLPYSFATIFGTINSCLYCMSAIFAYKTLANEKTEDLKSKIDFTTQLLTGNPYYIRN